MLRQVILLHKFVLSKRPLLQTNTHSGLLRKLTEMSLSMTGIYFQGKAAVLEMGDIPQILNKFCDLVCLGHNILADSLPTLLWPTSVAIRTCFQGGRSTRVEERRSWSKLPCSSGARSRGFRHYVRYLVLENKCAFQLLVSLIHIGKPRFCQRNTWLPRSAFNSKIPPPMEMSVLSTKSRCCRTEHICRRSNQFCQQNQGRQNRDCANKN